MREMIQNLDAIDLQIKRQGRTINVFAWVTVGIVMLAVIVASIIITHISEAERLGIDQINKSNLLIIEMRQVIDDQDSTIVEKNHQINIQQHELAQKDTIIQLQKTIIKDLKQDIRQLEDKLENTEGIDFNRRFGAPLQQPGAEGLDQP